MSQFTTRPESLPPQGDHQAICTGVIFLGHIPGYQGKLQSKVYLNFELPFFRRDYSKAGQATKWEPKLVSQEYGVIMIGISFLRKHLAQWKGEELIAEMDRFSDPWLLIGEPATITLTDKTTKQGKTVQDITDIKKPVFAPEQFPPQHHPPLIMLLRNTPEKAFDVPTFLSLPEYMRAKIRSSTEWQEMQLGKVVAEYQAAQVF